MAKRVRDYKAEERRRNELAKSRGYKNRYELRRKIETGKAAPLQPKRVRSPKTKAAQAARKAPKPTTKEIPTEIGGYQISAAQMAADWSAMFARSEIAQYRPERATELGMTRGQYTDAYLRAFVVGEDRYAMTRRNHKGASPDLYHWFVTVNRYMEADEYESRYGPVA